jgi:GntR family transcriptional regulator
LFIVLKPDNPDPLYQQVTDQLKDAMASGDLGPGEALPSIRELAAELNVSVITIKRAYQDLENEGWIITRRGMGSFVAEIQKQDLREARLAEMREELRRMIVRGRKFGIEAEDLRNEIQIMIDDGNGGKC